MICYDSKGGMDHSCEDESDAASEVDWEARRTESLEEERKEKVKLERPWLIEVTGEWKMILRQIDEEEADTPQWMKIYYEDVAGRRQYYAESQIEHHWQGLMPICPG